jgi:hypothetical protein
LQADEGEVTPLPPALDADSGPDEIGAYFEQTYNISVQPIVPPPEPGLSHAVLPSAQEALALAGILSRLPNRLLIRLSDHGALSHILFLKTARRTALASYNRGIIRIFPSALRLHVLDPIFGRLTIFEATVLHEISEALYRLFLDSEPQRLAGVRSLCTPPLRSLFEDCYLWWLETGEPPGVSDESEPHVLAAIITAAVASPASVRREPFRPLLEAIGVLE